VKKSTAAATAIARYVESERPGFWSGKTESASVQVINTKTTSQLQWIPIRIPAIRPISKPSLTAVHISVCRAAASRRIGAKTSASIRSAGRKTIVREYRPSPSMSP
jgi:hypothetical protein